MPAPKVKEWMPVSPRGGRLVHATSMESARKTVCNKPCDGWRVAPLPLTCPRCKELVHMPVRRRKS